MATKIRVFKNGRRTARLASAKYGSRKEAMNGGNPLNLEAIRMAQGYSQTEVARAIGVSPQAVSQWEAGVKIPSDKNKKSLCIFLRCTITELIDWRE